jgi:hypothetical protein
MNYATDPWYEDRRTKVIQAVSLGKPINGKREKRQSPLGKYSLTLTPYVVKDRRCPFYSVVEIIRNSDGEKMGKVIRNEADFPFLFVENHIDGKDYLMCAEDYQGFTIICITDGKKWDYVAEKSKRDLALRITDFHLSPNKMSLAIEGHAKGKPSDIVETDEVHFFLINEITKLPYKEVDKRIGFAYDKVIGWENDERIIISRIEDYIMPTGICLDDVQNQEERLVYLKSGNIKKQTAYYAYSPKSGVMEKVFSEWR